MIIQDSVLFITGANRGLGLAFAEQALQRGARKIYAGVRKPNDESRPGITQVGLDVTDHASIAEAANQCGDTTLLINNAGIARLTSSTLDPSMIEGAREILETNYFGTIAVSQAFAPILARNGGGAIINVLSDATWYARPMLAAYSASKSAAWSFTNALRIELRGQNTAVLGLHVSFMDTDMTHGFDMKKTSPQQAAEAALIGLEANKEEVLVDDFTREVKRSLAEEKPIYLDPPPLG
ncbi:MAG: SDR family oxidoreductase [Mesorhizobium sp.]|uniref:SDR family oxidoreductase n=1 Tax=Mesorhizobium sp. TaxID=1871066 RepID=UPI000FE676F3|nr:SDR family oxidoreductase [Mesorhizobium sp.]RWI14959.1 MAG: SDR family oxidoreductase [Mesorhizobium sp.]RWK45032.1 MAG: SDR family oxidoreductase [Mesorhizobium sp.]RWK91254.1 MAG: SDR family oxidoreductase [Mesorhizobium sp.]RWM12944.1 MAG: SDR family oxidoreductase [Mesorhizobium sp.]TIP56173.1 MAG: SDR family oxidoreductase [Mesorhizobium sp.]